MFWFICSIIAVAFSPVGRAIGDRLAGRIPDRDESDEMQRMAMRIEDRMLELEDRLEAAELLLGPSQGASD